MPIRPRVLPSVKDYRENIDTTKNITFLVTAALWGKSFEIFKTIEYLLIM